MRNITKLAFSVAMIISAGMANAKTELSVWEDIQKSKGIEQAVADFEKEFDVDVKIQEMPYTTQIEKLRLDGPAGIGPDVMVIPHDQLGAAVVQNLISPLNKLNKEIYTESSLSAFTTNGNVYGAPKVVETIAMFYNKDLIKEPFENLEDYYTYSKEHTKDGNYGLLAKFDSTYYVYGAIKPYGAYVFKRNDSGDYDATDVGLSNAGAVEGMTYIKKFYKDGLFPTGIIGENGVNAIDSLFTEKKAAAVINGPWAVEPYQKAGINFGVVSLPKLPNGQPMSSFMGVKGYVVSTWSKDKELAEKFINYINQPKYAAIRFEKTMEIPPVKEVMNDPKFKENPIASAIAVQASRAEPMPSIPEMSEVWGPIDAALQLIVTDKQDVKSALEGATEHINNQIEAFRSGM
ncbi:extracellular solute-binding protein [Succinivibrio dextrinosolvens]|uniref:extracellular solute-binding protein n=1 Tax=Succinivibrio dextrinosolvens TaxID=83771 RepID=UPI001921A795|nr:extracellular solute-binding protein [Succinivibrio dextrinosolvens]